MTKRQITLHIVSHTRWDREGQHTFQESRLRLVSLLDDLLNILSGQPEYTFMLDGQVVILTDYLEIRPEQRAAVSRCVKKNQLYIGPWYILPDEFLVSPESLVRNLLIGAQTASEFGSRMDVGYVPNSSGHIGQMPQILKGFGIESAIAMQGLGDAPTELWWEALDGSRVFLVHLRDGFSNAAALPPDPEDFKKALVHARDNLMGYSACGVLLLMNGDNYETVHPEIPDLTRNMKRRFRGTYVMHSSLPAYVTHALEDPSDFPTVLGELRSPELFPLFAGVLSARIKVKQHNHAIQTLLEKWAEPFSAWADFIGEGSSPEIHPSIDRVREPGNLLKHAWKLLLQNHTPPSIQGCATDQVHRETQTRFDHAKQIAEAITCQSLNFLAGQVDTTSLPHDGDLLPIVVFNATGHRCSEAVSIEVSLPPDFQSFEIIDEIGDAQPFMLKKDIASTEGDELLPTLFRIRFIANDVPAYGYRTYALCPTEEPPAVAELDAGLMIENEYLSVELNPVNGTFTLYDKQTGRSFSGLNHFIDGGDRGDTYNYCAPEQDTLIDIATNTPLHVRRCISEVEQTLNLLQIYRLPQTLKRERNARLPLAAQFVPISINTTLRIIRSVPRVDIEVTVTNSAQDHRLRAHFPTGIVTQEGFFAGHFEVVRRSLPPTEEKNTAHWAEQPVPEQPQRAFVTVLGDETGLTIANRGLPEAAILPGDGGVEIALTLLRCVGWSSRNDLPNRQGNVGLQAEAPDAQCHGEHEFMYSVIPHGVDPLLAWQYAWAFQSPPRAVATGIQSGILPLSGSLVTVDNPSFVLSAVKTAMDGKGLIVRGYSISEGVEAVSLWLGLPLSNAKIVRLDESSTGTELKEEDGCYCFEVQPAEIVTIRFF